MQRQKLWSSVDQFSWRSKYMLPFSHSWSAARLFPAETLSLDPERKQSWNDTVWQRWYCDTSHKDKPILTWSILIAGIAIVTNGIDACHLCWDELHIQTPRWVHTLTSWCLRCSLSRSCCLRWATVFSNSPITSEAWKRQTKRKLVTNAVKFGTILYFASINSKFSRLVWRVMESCGNVDLSSRQSMFLMQVAHVSLMFDFELLHSLFILLTLLLLLLLQNHVSVYS